MREENEVRAVGDQTENDVARLEVVFMAECVRVLGGEAADGAVAELFASDGIGMDDLVIVNAIWVIAGDEFRNGDICWKSEW